MAGFLSNNFFLASFAAGFSPTACDFDHSDNSKMSRTLGTPSNADKFTMSWWEKRNSASRYSVSASGYSTGEIYDYLFHHAGDNTIRWEAQNGTSSYSVYSTGAYGSGTWRHYVYQYDTSLYNDTDRIKWYINGSQLSVSTRYSGFPPGSGDGGHGTHGNSSLDRDSLMNSSGATFSIGHIPTYNGYADSLFSEVVLTDAQIYAPSTFGQDDGGTWKAKEVADNVTFGNNGFYLTFQNASSLGADTSGNSNDFTLSNITSDHQEDSDVPPSV